MAYLVKATNTYRVTTVQEALDLRKEIQNSCNGTLISFSYTTKYIKQKGEIVDEYQLCKATVEFTSEKEPERVVTASYED